MEQTPITQNKFGHWLKTSITARMIMIATIILVLLIPLAFVKELIREREFRQTDVVNEINEKWGSEVTLYGPILKVPYKTYKEKSVFNPDTKQYVVEKESFMNYAYFFPKKLDYNAQAKSKTKKRNNFESVVYESNITITGAFNKPNFSSKSIKDEDIIWNKSSIVFKTSNLKGIKSQVAIQLNKHSYDFETNYHSEKQNRYDLDELESSYLKLENLDFSKPQSFTMNLAYNGSKSMKFIPIGKTTTAKMTSNWVNPSFTGNFLPQDEGEKVSKDGFKANWKVLDINRPFSQQFFNHLPNLNEYAFGTNFIVPVDEYQKSDRSTKYGFMVIGLTFLIFFLIQTMSKINIHPFQYVMIGVALVMFYTLLISISEHSSFLKAYLIAGTAVITLITLYSKSILKNIKFPVLIGTCLTVLYGFIFVIIQLENYALLVGSVGLFTILAVVMFVSRKIDWNNG
ncbi:cell envelope integrity protein CreD [Pseudofulvibacter geojedonensis]|uniref:Cell envelope integrity protein CreD n=1 Tax=Pseudofulvibacter geojedonensis TaxID=1123758 RepID=A0ABW3I580_9FLAO